MTTRSLPIRQIILGAGLVTRFLAEVRPTEASAVIVGNMASGERRGVEPRRKQSLIGQAGWLALLGLLLVSWYETRPPRPLTIALYQGVEGAALKKVAQRFSDQEKVPVRILEFSYDELYKREFAETWPSRTSEDNGPRFDVMMVDDPWLPALAVRPAPGAQPVLAAKPRDSRLKRIT